MPRLLATSGRLRPLADGRADEPHRRLLDEQRIGLRAAQMSSEQMLLEVREPLGRRVRCRHPSVADRAALGLELLQRARMQGDVQALVASPVAQSPLVGLAGVVEHDEVRRRKHGRGAVWADPNGDVREDDERRRTLDHVHVPPRLVLRWAGELGDAEERAREKLAFSHVRTPTVIAARG